MNPSRPAVLALAAAAVLLLPSCGPRPQPFHEDEVWVYVDLTPHGDATAEVWIRGKEAEVREVSEAAAPLLFPGGVVESILVFEDEESDLHGEISVDAAFRPGPEVVAGFDLTELASELQSRGYSRGSLGLCWPEDGPARLQAAPPPDGDIDTCAYWSRFPEAVDATLTHEPAPERWLVRVPLLLLTGALPVGAIVALKRSRRRPDGAKKAFRWSLAGAGALFAVFAYPPVGDPGTSLALSGLAGPGVTLPITVGWWVLFAVWVFLLYFIAPLLLLIALVEVRRARKLERTHGAAPPGPLD